MIPHAKRKSNLGRVSSLLKGKDPHHKAVYPLYGGLI